MSTQPFPLQALPEALRQYVQELSASTGFDQPVTALASLAALAGAIGGTCLLRLKSGVYEPPLLWALLVTAPGAPQPDLTPLLQAVLAPLRAVQAAEMDQYERSLRDYAVEMRTYLRRLRRVEQALEQDADSDLEHPEMPVKPTVSRLLSQEQSPYELLRTITGIRRGTLLARPCVDPWLAEVLRDPRWRELADGRPVTLAGPTPEAPPAFNPYPAINVLGGVQGVTLAGEALDMMFPVLLNLPPSGWSTCEVSGHASAVYHEVLERIARQKWVWWENWAKDLTDGKSDAGPAPVGPTPAMAELWARSYDGLKERGIAHHAARLAMIVQYFRFYMEKKEEGARDMVDEKALSSGIELAGWFAAERQRVRQLVAGSVEEQRRQQMLGRLRALGSECTVRKLMRSGPCFPTAAAARAALDDLAHAGLGAWGERGTFRLRQPAGPVSPVTVSAAPGGG